MEIIETRMSQREIEKLLKQQERPMTAAEIAQELNANPKTIKHQLCALNKNKRVKRHSRYDMKRNWCFSYSLEGG